MLLVLHLLKLAEQTSSQVRLSQVLILLEELVGHTHQLLLFVWRGGQHILQVLIDITSSLLHLCAVTP